mmetsp:Transcript_24138/g.72509  ORF Transcript_24138/g.72509 Transcript_24138/m.72509 type:complete len:218 (-) Transcript_24138:438-1091(-)
MQEDHLRSGQGEPVLHLRPAEPHAEIAVGQVGPRAEQAGHHAGHRRRRQRCTYARRRTSGHRYPGQGGHPGRAGERHRDLVLPLCGPVAPMPWSPRIPASRLVLVLLLVQERGALDVGRVVDAPGHVQSQDRLPRVFVHRLQRTVLRVARLVRDRLRQGHARRAGVPVAGAVPRRARSRAVQRAETHEVDVVGHRPRVHPVGRAVRDHGHRPGGVRP